jgi:hypothetical protein
VEVGGDAEGVLYAVVVVCRREVHAGNEWWFGSVHEFDIGEWVE